MSSLKGQLSNVEGSVKSMKVAVVVGSVLTVACLAAVFGVTVLANEVSKEVKVSNGELTAKSGEMVKTATLTMSADMTPSVADKTVALKFEDSTMTAVIAATVSTTEEYVYVLDGAVLKVNKATNEQSFNVQAGSLLATSLSGSVEARQPNAILSAIALCAMNPVCAAGAIAAGKAIVTGLAIGATALVAHKLINK